MNKLFAISLSLLFLPFLGFSQISEEDTPVSNQLRFGAYAHTHGVGLVTEFVLFRDGPDFIFGLNFQSVKHRKEQKVGSFHQDIGGSDFIFDKRNYFYNLTPTFGFSWDLVKHSSNSAVGFNASLQAGPILGILKPYYIEVAITPGSSQYYVDEVPYDGAQWTYNEIYGEADYFLGTNELAVTAGLQLKAVGTLNFSDGPEYVRALQIGIYADIYPKKVPILDVNPNQSLFVGGSVGVVFGNGW